MKKNKKNKAAENTDAKQISSGRLRRRQEQLQKEALESERSRIALFKRRVREASEQKAPKTLRTKAYYRFTKEYPSNVTPDGFRENTPETDKLSNPKRFLLISVCIAVFVLTFIAVLVCLEFTKKAPAADIPVQPTPEAVPMLALHFTPEELKNKSPEEIEKELLDKGCNTAVFEFKSEYGYVYFDINSFIGSSADKKISDAWDTVSYLSEKGIKCAAYISCFKDTIAASALTGIEVTDKDNILFKDSNYNCWLDPFSDRAANYLLGIISAAEKGGFHHIILDNVCFPHEYSSSSPYYGEENETASAKNAALHGFINDAVRKTENSDIIILGDISAFADISSLPDKKYGGKVIPSECSSFAVDFREEKQNNELLSSAADFTHVRKMPLAFILDAGTLAYKTLSNEKDALMLVSLIDKAVENGDTYSRYAKIENIIYW